MRSPTDRIRLAQRRIEMKRYSDLCTMKSTAPILRMLVLLSLLVVADIASARDLFILATGRRDPRIYAIDFAAALKPQNNNTANAIISRSKVLPDRLDGTPIGDPANIVLSEDQKTAYVINHHGAVNNAEFLQHGGRGSTRIPLRCTSGREAATMLTKPSTIAI